MTISAAIDSSPEQIKVSPSGAKKGVSLSLGFRLIGAFGAGLLLASSFPPVNLPILLPFGIALLLWMLEGTTPRIAGYLGLLTGFVFFACTLIWLKNMFGTATVSLWALAAGFPALFAAFFIRLRVRLPMVPLWLLAGVLWTAEEYFRSELMKPSFGFMGLGYALVNAPLWMIAASVIGSYGLTFLIVVIGAGIAFGGRNARIGLILVWVLMIFFPRSSQPIKPASPVSVRLVQANSEDDESLFDLSRKPSARPIDIIVWPEYSFVSDPTRDTKLWARLTNLPQTARAYLLFGAKDQFDKKNEAGFRNTAFLLDTNGKLIGRHVKNHTVPFIRDGVAGKDASVFPTSFGPAGVAICFDMDFPDVARRLAANGAEIFLVPSDNPAEWGAMQRAQHRQMFQMRAAECGRWLATTDVAGNTGLFSPDGREVDRVVTSEPAFLDVEAGRERTQTLFVRGGWRFGQVCLLISITLALMALARRPA